VTPTTFDDAAEPVLSEVEVRLLRVTPTPFDDAAEPVLSEVEVRLLRVTPKKASA
jgi:hypothetical protein